MWRASTKASLATIKILVQHAQVYVQAILNFRERNITHSVRKLSAQPFKDDFLRLTVQTEPSWLCLLPLVLAYLIQIRIHIPTWDDNACEREGIKQAESLAFHRYDVRSPRLLLLLLIHFFFEDPNKPLRCLTRSSPAIYEYFYITNKRN